MDPGSNFIEVVVNFSKLQRSLVFVHSGQYEHCWGKHYQGCHGEGKNIWKMNFSADQEKVWEFGFEGNVEKVEKVREKVRKFQNFPANVMVLAVF